jgi:hypothetical protein
VHNEGIHVNDGRSRLSDDEELLFVGVVAHFAELENQKNGEKITGSFQRIKQCLLFAFFWYHFTRLKYQIRGLGF